MFNIKRIDKPKDLVKVYRTFGVLKTLEIMYKHCYLCNTKLTGGDNLEHIIPKVDHPELTLIWENLLLSCPKCNNSKGAKSGVIDPTSNENVIHELFSYNFRGIMKVNYRNIYSREIEVSEMRELAMLAQQTIDFYQLNRFNLIADRHECIVEYSSYGKIVSKSKHIEYKGLLLSSQEYLERLGVKYE